MSDLMALQRAATQCEGDIVAARAAIARAADMLAAIRRDLDVLATLELARLARVGRGDESSMAAGVEAQVGSFSGGVVG